MFVEECLMGVFGVCCDVRVFNVFYWQDIFYYGIVIDVCYLELFCVSQS